MSFESDDFRLTIKLFARSSNVDLISSERKFASNSAKSSISFETNVPFGSGVVSVELLVINGAELGGDVSGKSDGC